ncbi:MAG: phosphonate metabolism protein/1,5-bisphosphokinase (PRPP-forming) PhnN [Promethearchaeota archaeon]
MRKKFTGILFLIVGNSGSGKDSIIQGAVKKYPNDLNKLYVPKRYITRDPSKTEENISISPEEFRIMSKEGKFALKWHIYGLDYGISIEIDEKLKNGQSVAVNVSRIIIPEAKKVYENTKVIFIEVPFDITLKRLKERTREIGKRLEERLERARNNQKFPEADYIIDNSGLLDDAIDQFINYVIKCIEQVKNRIE